MFLLCMTPFATDLNLGRAYNEAMALLPDDGWAALLDHDATFLTREWNRQIREAIAFLPDAGLFGAMTNRIAPRWQQCGDANDHDIHRQRLFAKERLKVRTLLDVTDTKGLGGVLLVLSKKAWLDVGGFKDGLYCVDHQIMFSQRAAGRRCYIIEGLQLYHWRRAFKDEPPRDAPFAKDCPCRGPEKMPTERLVLP